MEDIPTFDKKSPLYRRRAQVLSKVNRLGDGKGRALTSERFYFPQEGKGNN